MSTITREFTKKQLIAAACSRIDFAKQMLRGNPLPLAKRKWEIELSISEIALASLETEPVAYADPQAFRNFKTGSARREWMWRNPGEDLIPLYTAPPAPVTVPDAYIRDERGRMMLNGNPEPRIGYGGGWNACRAAMLQGGKS